MARNPFRSEAEAYRFLLLTVGYFALIVAAAALATWLGLVVFVLLTALVIWRWARSRHSTSSTANGLTARRLRYQSTAPAVNTPGIESSGKPTAAITTPTSAGRRMK